MKSCKSYVSGLLCSVLVAFCADSWAQQNMSISRIEAMNCTLPTATKMHDNVLSNYVQPTGLSITSPVKFKIKLNQVSELSSLTLYSKYVTSYTYQNKYITFQPTVISILPYNSKKAGTAMHLSFPLTGRQDQIVNFPNKILADELVVTLYASLNSWKEVNLNTAKSQDVYYPYLSEVYVKGTVPTCESWTNLSNIYDVNEDKVVTPQDVLFIFNYLNAGGITTLPKCNNHPNKLKLDVNKDGIVSSLDGLVIVNYLNAK